MAEKLVKVGEVGVDAGLVWVGDPCYIMHRPPGMPGPADMGASWSEFCKKMDGHKPVQFSLGVCSPTHHGDGVYPVYAVMDKGRVAKLVIDFKGG